MPTTLDDLEARIFALENRANVLDYGSDVLRFGKDIASPATTAVAIFLVDTTYNGENFSAGDVLIGNNTTDVSNFVYKNSVFQARYGSLDTVTIGAAAGGLRVVRGGLALKQVDISATLNGNEELDENGAAITSSHIRIPNASGAFTIQSLAEPDNPNTLLILENVTTENMTLTNDFGSASPGYWTIHTYTGADVSTTGDGIALLMGNEGNSRWDLISIRG